MNLKIFRNVFSNIIICFVIVVIVYLTSGMNAIATSGSDGTKAIYRGNTENKNVSIMINVYWGTEYLEPMLEILQEKGVNATFFVGGIWAVQNESLLKKIHNLGFEIGNHGYNHKDHDKLSAEHNKQEITATHEIVKRLTGVEMNLFAPPSGAYNNVTINVANQLGYKTIMWTLDTIDWRDKDTNLIYSRATKKLTNGALVLMHPTQNTLEALPNIIDYYLSNSYQVVNVSTNIAFSW